MLTAAVRRRVAVLRQPRPAARLARLLWTAWQKRAMNERALHAMTPVGEGTLLRWVRQIPLCAQLGQIDRSPAMNVARFRVGRSLFSEHCDGLAQR